MGACDIAIIPMFIGNFKSQTIGGVLLYILVLGLPKGTKVGKITAI